MTAPVHACVHALDVCTCIYVCAYVHASNPCTHACTGVCMHVCTIKYRSYAPPLCALGKRKSLRGRILGICNMSPVHTPPLINREDGQPRSIRDGTQRLYCNYMYSSTVHVVTILRQLYARTHACPTRVPRVSLACPMLFFVYGVR